MEEKQEVAQQQELVLETTPMMKKLLDLDIYAMGIIACYFWSYSQKTEQKYMLKRLLFKHVLFQLTFYFSVN